MAIAESTAALIGSGLAAAGTAASITIGGKMNSRAVGQAQESRRWQSRERELQQAWQEEQVRRANDWSLEQWNRQNEYDSMSSQVQRMKEAGFSPLAALQANGQSQGLESAQVSGATTPGGTLPQLSNPVPPGSFDNVANQFLSWKKLELERKNLDRLGRETDADVGYKEALIKTVNELRAGQVEFQGVQIALGKSQKGLTDQQKEREAKEILKIDKEIDQLNKWIETEDVNISLKQFDLWSRKKNFPKEQLLLARQCIAAKLQNQGLKHHNQALIYENYGRYYDAKNRQWYNKQGYEQDDLRAAHDVNQANKLSAEGQVYSPFGYSVKRGMSLVSDVLAPISDIMQSFFFYSAGKKALKPMPTSQPNWLDPATPSSFGNAYQMQGLMRDIRTK